MAKFLIIRFSSIGDIVLTTPIVRAIKTRYPDAEVHYVTKKGFYDIIRYSPYIDKIHLLDGTLSALVTSLKQEKFDYIIDLHHNLRSLIIKLRLFGVKAYSFPKLNFAKWLLVRLKWNVMPDIHIVDRYFKTLAKLDLKNDASGLDFFLPEEDVFPTEKLPNFFNEPYIALVIGAKHYTKRIPTERVIELSKKLIFPIVILGGPEESDQGNFIAKKSGLHVFNACGKLSLLESAAVIQKAKLVISSDTGLMHIASAYKRDIFSVWGNTTPNFGMYPYMPGSRSKIFEVIPLSCRPCSKIGFDSCPKKHFKCMQDIPYHQIIIDSKEIMKV
ncbi:glycosyltransferase family 9 protein [Williamwhitmania taraxaci]|uniref:ADP-heptose:LPS heptosyltransferase n=1 Tax=Williamwhitmania taraxaci TaxID=1640674 RepID=A0A1G6GZR7_9BACT|nr:glycosyltransferase family 9 protein [Williamwhitmania taraxaci]SDB87175.1 ADP-heptose:LPS heptosyltransferase [Williamwhitmania taraxaci]